MTMYVELLPGNFGFDYLLTYHDEDGVIDDEFIQSDWEYPSVAQMFGWTPCKDCNLTDGTVDCEHHTTSEMLQNAAEFLDEMLFETVVL